MKAKESKSPAGRQGSDWRDSYDFSVLRALRKRESLTLQGVSDRSGVSVAVISKLERNQTLADLDTLFRLSRVFGMNAADLLALTEARAVQKKNTSTHTSGGFHFQEVAYGNVRCLLGRAAKDARLSRPEIHQDDYELCWMLDGAMRVQLPAEQHVLKSGDAIQFDAILAHTYEILKDSQFLILHLPKPKRY